MNPIHQTSCRTILAVMLAGWMAAPPARAWNPPPGEADRTKRPETPTTLLWEAHGYLIQTGISVLHNDGYWFARPAPGESAGAARRRPVRRHLPRKAASRREALLFLGRTM